MSAEDVTQADRDAAADYLDVAGLDWEACGAVRKGHVNHPAVQAFARHRIEATAAAQANADRLAEALVMLRHQALQSTVNDPANEWGREALEAANGALAAHEANQTTAPDTTREDALEEAWVEWFKATETLAELERAGDTTKRFDRALWDQEQAEMKARAALARKESRP